MTLEQAHKNRDKGLANLHKLAEIFQANGYSIIGSNMWQAAIAHTDTGIFEKDCGILYALAKFTYKGSGNE